MSPSTPPSAAAGTVDLEKRPQSSHAMPTPKKQKTTTAATDEEVPAPAVPAAAAPAVAPKFQSLQIKKLSPAAKTPTRGSAYAAGYDMYASKDTTVPARGKALVDTDIAIAVPTGTYGRIAPRSGLASKNFIDVGAGVIDMDYRGQVKILLFNHADTDFEVKAGDRVAQLIIEQILTPEIEEVEELVESVRGAGGFGSTGTN
ncbi:dUTP pyrophosphatase [Geopyxis carbonaria]|nr:dUTP pyrophosphatase [Geopyxis carbonaria]